jgi:hypothetical protein
MPAQGPAFEEEVGSTLFSNQYFPCGSLFGMSNQVVSSTAQLVVVNFNG